MNFVRLKPMYVHKVKLVNGAFSMQYAAVYIAHMAPLAYRWASDKQKCNAECCCISFSLTQVTLVDTKQHVCIITHN